MHVRETSPNKYEVVETVLTQLGSRTMAVDPKSHKLYLSVELFYERKDSEQGASKFRPVMIKDSFEILVVGKKKSPE